MPLGTEYSYGAGDVRAARAMVDHLELADDESIEFEFDDEIDAYTYHDEQSDVDYWIVSDHQLHETPSDEPPLFDAGGWNVYDVHPWGE